MFSPTILSLWSALCIGLVFSDEGTVANCPENSRNCTLPTACYNPHVEVKDGSQEIVSCKTDKGEDGLCCVTNAEAGKKSAEKCNEYAKSVFEQNSITGSLVDTCPDTERLVTNGNEAEPREFPHTALVGSIQYDILSWHCGGSLISELFVLTASYCSTGMDVFGTIWNASLVKLGEYDISIKEDKESELTQTEDYGVVNFFIHPGSDGEYATHDIALLKLNRSVVFNKFIRPICLNADQSNTHQHALVAGWFRTNVDTYQNSNILLKSNLTITDCSDIEYVEIESWKLESLICTRATDFNPHKGTCSGDGGGALQIRLENPHCMLSIIGISSFGPRPCNEAEPVAFTKVSPYIPWIESIVWP